MKIRFRYKGPVTRFGNFFCLYDGFTMAVSDKQALNNFKGKIKREKGLAMDARIELKEEYLSTLSLKV